MELVLSTFYLVCIIAFVHLCLDATLGLIVAFRRYCTASTYVTDLPNRWKHIRRRIKPYERPTDCSEDSDSDHTDIDAAVDEYKTQLYVSTVMSWNGSEILHRRQFLQSVTKHTNNQYIVHSNQCVTAMIMSANRFSVEDFTLTNKNYRNFE